ncbi:multidrug-resistance type transporter aminotriazole resistance [Lepraria neglecta]|uniref:Multidrug-resistance type transporter aminotriazole resistance n=1 Tax=Lepraria neglecta TaxID=209136 RepID=A0AAD9YXE0_9LECA|nr:multidrug-resistance type transporter aminotriazole resistance [Lepraria neglecta]
MAILIQEMLSPSLALLAASLELIAWKNFGISYLAVLHDTRKSQRTDSIFMGASAHLRTAIFTDKRKFYGNFVDQVDNFDHAFFRTNPKEALNMDSQQRVLLELAYQAMESSGYLGLHQREWGDTVGCFIGASFAEYLDNTNAHPPTAYTSTETIRAFLCGN